MLRKSDAELRDLGWRWALRDPSGALLAVTLCAEDVGEWDRRYGHDHRIVPLAHVPAPHERTEP